MIPGNYIFPPTTEHLLLLKYTLYVMLLLHLPFMGMVFGGAILSLAFNLLEKKTKNRFHVWLSLTIIDTVLFKRSVGIILGICPLLTLIFIFPQLFYDMNITITLFMLHVLVFAALGLGLLYLYRGSFIDRDRRFTQQIGMGILGTFFVANAYGIFACVSALMTDPDKWGFILKPHHLLFSWNIVPLFMEFVFISLGITGAGLLFFTFVWAGGKRAATMNDQHHRIIRITGLSTALGSLVVLPVMEFWQTITVPLMAITTSYFFISGLSIILFFIMCLIIVHLLKSGPHKLYSHLFILFIAVFALLIIKNQGLRENAAREHTMVLVTRAELVKAEYLDQHRIEIEEDSSENIILKGEKLYKKICSSCHAFDRKIVGPPLNSVLSKYRNNAEALTAFLNKPEKINPAYPAMPKPALRQREREAVVAYVLQYQKEPDTVKSD